MASTLPAPNAYVSRLEYETLGKSERMRLLQQRIRAERSQTSPPSKPEQVTRPSSAGPSYSYGVPSKTPPFTPQFPPYSSSHTPLPSSPTFSGSPVVSATSLNSDEAAFNHLLATDPLTARLLLQEKCRQRSLLRAQAKQVASSSPGLPPSSGSSYQSKPEQVTRPPSAGPSYSYGGPPIGTAPYAPAFPPYSSSFTPPSSHYGAPSNTSPYPSFTPYPSFCAPAPSYPPSYSASPYSPYDSGKTTYVQAGPMTVPVSNPVKTPDVRSASPSTPASSIPRTEDPSSWSFDETWIFFDHEKKAFIGTKLNVDKICSNPEEYVHFSYVTEKQREEFYLVLNDGRPLRRIYVTDLVMKEFMKKYPAT